jgi:tricorn protease
VVESDPASVIAGRDPQFERVIAEIQRILQSNPKNLSSRPTDPDKASKR